MPDQEFETLEAEVNKYKTLSLLLPKVEGEGSSVTLNNTVEGVTMDITPEGATSQDGTPTPEAPIPIKVVTGEQNIQIGTTNYPLSLGTLELAEIGDYKDYIYGTPNNWYKKSLIGKGVLDGSENYQSAGSNDNYWEYRRSALTSGGTNQAVNSITTHFNQTDYSRIVVTGGGAIYLRFPKSAGIDISTTTLMKNWTTSNNVTFYYVLATPTSEPITDTTLIEQLNNLYNAISAQGTTYITCSSASDDNETLQVKASAYKDISSILNPVVESEG